MAPDRVKALLDRNPFLPILLRMTDGTRLRVSLPEDVRIGPAAKWLWVRGLPLERVDWDSVADVEVEKVPEDYIAGNGTNGGRMTVEKFDEFLKRRPFVPFTVHTADGAEFEVKSPEFAARTQNGRTIFISTGDERTEWIDLLLVVRISSGLQNVGSAG